MAKRKNEPVRMLVGERLYLRPIERADADRCRRWINDPEVSRYLLYARAVGEAAEEAWIASMSEGNVPSSLHLAIVIRKGDRHIGNVGFHDIDWVHRHAVTGTLIGEKDCWGLGYAPEAKALLLAHGFDSMGLHHVTATTFAENVRSQRQLEKSGYALEGRLREHVFRDGRWHDDLVYGILDHEWRAKRAALPA